MKRSFVSILLLLTLLLLTACGNGRIMQGVIVLEDDSILQPPASTNQLPSAPADGGEPAGDDQPPADSLPAAGEDAEGAFLFAYMPAYFSFSSGAGAWSTDIELSEDGSFSGSYHDSDMGVLDEALYPNGTVYYCNFSGRFSRPEKVDEYTYTMRLESLTVEDTEGEMYYEDGIRWVASAPYGLENADEVLIYLPGTRMDSLSEEIGFWLMAFIYGDMPEELPCYVLYNVSEEYAFVGYEG